jgi:hypothetical protein
MLGFTSDKLDKSCTNETQKHMCNGLMVKVTKLIDGIYNMRISNFATTDVHVCLI